MVSLQFKRLTILVIISLVVNLYVFTFMYSRSVEAADLTKAAILTYRMGLSTPATSTNPILVVVKPASVDTEAQVRVDLAAGFTVGAATSGTVVATTVNLPSTFQNTVLVALPHTGAGSVVANSLTNMITIPTADLSGNGNTLYGILLISGVTNPNAAGGTSTYVSTISTRNSSGTAIDIKRVASQITSASGDQVTITASVPPTFNFILTSNSLALGALSTSSVTTGNIGFSVYTNANGWAAWVRGVSQGSGATNNGALYSSSTADAIESVGTLGTTACSAYSAGSEFYQLDADVATDGTGGGSPQAAYYYACSGTDGGTIGKGVYAEVANASGPANGDVMTLTAKAAVSNLNKAADDYTDTWDVVGAGSF